MAVIKRPRTKMMRKMMNGIDKCDKSDGDDGMLTESIGKRVEILLRSTNNCVTSR